MLKRVIDFEKSSLNIGLALRAAREDMGASIEDIAKSFNIQPKYLHAIEYLDEKNLPSIGYVLGYVRTYASHVGIDPAQAIARYKIDIKCPHNLSVSSKPHFVPKQQLKLPKGSAAAIVTLFCFIVIASWYGLRSNAEPGGFFASPLPETGHSTIPASTATQIEPGAMVLKAVGPSWVEIKAANGRILVSRILVPGETLDLSRQDAPLLSIRDAGAVELHIGGKRIGSFGAPGEMIRNVPLLKIAP